eukprot:TRINITY_DN0_c0_g1_i2.p1 TRINITY_DN0_c0_g1~~TRINITY_DN0_c0_g1_i2.p1  ORF type:complete len:343 (+),score=72.82 TRINITY_DN0_c0_g1_i2:60-1088(+)
MKVATVLIVLAALAVFTLAAENPGYSTYSKLSEQEQNVLFKEFAHKHQKVYGSNEIKYRLAAFKSNLKRIDELNARNTSAQFGITKFADVTEWEFKTLYLGTKVPTTATQAPVAPLYSKEQISALPSSYDWRTKGAVTPVKNQGQCGSCWSFSTTGNVEGQWKLAGHSLVGLSEQNLVDCSQPYGNEGCNGGLMGDAFKYIIANRGIDSEQSYPYEASTGTCQFNRANVAAQINNWTMISSNEDQMASYLVEHGPLSIAADAQEWQFYVGGVFSGACGTQLDHGILIVGYDHEVDWFGYDIQYWWVKNSWGADWGYSGYLKIIRGVGECGLNKYVCSSIISK